MKKRNIGMLVLYMILGWLVGAWVAKLLQPVKALSFLTKSTLIKWSPQADLDIISYDVTIKLKLCMLSLIGIIIAVWLYRRK
ncbi:hypothetical protein J2Z22_004670 [Paenibacillus forsythiae]|uniref:DUF4321 domain-containing protein n=1 Tax=Paenibacillus forsythiae TaxID=365616 RepID=A0ABU3HE19_9BACL|nr:DUF4321 domain-containing protein [Paenibacillus forsythiae]MDT3429071.1 hypothetical protein [Paenibacillus forsythiae]